MIVFSRAIQIYRRVLERPRVSKGRDPIYRGFSGAFTRIYEGHLGAERHMATRLARGPMLALGVR